MAMRSHTTYKKRQKELARLEKQREKVAKRAERKLAKRALEGGDAMVADNTDAEAEAVEAPPEGQ